MSPTHSPKQVAADQCRVVAHFARAIASVFDDKAEIAKAGECQSLIVRWIEQTDDLMEQLGNILNGLDAVTDEDEWTFPIVKESVARRAALSKARPSNRGEA